MYSSVMGWMASFTTIFNTRINPRLDASGDLLIADDDQDTGKAALIQHAPVIYQLAANGKRQPVRGSYRVAEDGTVTLVLGNYDHSARLVVDPVIEYTQYLFGTSADTAVAVTHDSHGFLYLAGNTLSTDFYIQGNYAYLGNSGGQDAWVMKINPLAPDGNFVPFTTYYGGSLNEFVKGIAVDNNGIAYITGSTASSNIPTAGAYATALPGQTSTFIAAFDTNQAILTYGTYIGGTLVDNVAGIAL